MREIRPSGSEGGGAEITGSSYPYHPAKGEALVYRSHHVLYSSVSCGLRPNGPTVRRIHKRHAWD